MMNTTQKSIESTRQKMLSSIGNLIASNPKLEAVNDNDKLVKLSLSLDEDDSKLSLEKQEIKDFKLSLQKEIRNGFSNNTETIDTLNELNASCKTWLNQVEENFPTIEEAETKCQERIVNRCCDERYILALQNYKNPSNAESFYSKEIPENLLSKELQEDDAWFFDSVQEKNKSEKHSFYKSYRTPDVSFSPGTYNFSDIKYTIVLPEDDDNILLKKLKVIYDSLPSDMQTKLPDIKKALNTMTQTLMALETGGLNGTYDRMRSTSAKIRSNLSGKNFLKTHEYALRPAFHIKQGKNFYETHLSYFGMGTALIEIPSTLYNSDSEKIRKKHLTAVLMAKAGNLPIYFSPEGGPRELLFSEQQVKENSDKQLFSLLSDRQKSKISRQER